MLLTECQKEDLELVYKPVSWVYSTSYAILQNFILWASEASSSVDSRLSLTAKTTGCIFKGAVSDWCSVTSGVPQGSVLGPIFFVLFVNDINDVVSSPLFQFADDHTVLRPILSERDHVALQNDIHNIFQWTLRNKLPLNLSKCSVMHMTRSKSPNYCDT